MNIFRGNSMNKDIILNKISIIKNCLHRISEEYDNSKFDLENNYTKQDSIILNLQRACEASIDLGAHIIKTNDFDIPQSSRDVFCILEKNKILTKKISEDMQKMVGFRNISIHDYINLDMEILKSILDNKLGDFLIFIDEILEYYKE